MIFDPDIIDAFRDTIEKSKKITIVSHKNADADTLGCSLALSAFFNNKNIENTIIVPNALPDYFSWISDIDKIMIYENQPWDAVTVVQESDIIFMVDFNEWSRIEALADAIQVSKALKIVIDHHPEPQSIADFMFVDSKSSSAAQLVYQFMKIFDPNAIDKIVAEHIFMGIASDTGSFKYSSVTAETFEIAAELLKYGIDKDKIINGLFNNFSFDRLRLFGYIMSNETYHLKDKGITYMMLSKKIRNKFSYKKGDQENLVNWAMSVKGTRFGVIFVENDDVVRISFRSTGNFDVSKIAKQFYNGGGHRNASGGKSSLSLKETVENFVKNIDKLIELAESK